MNQPGHTPVLVKETIEQFSPQPGNTLLDATLGHGGHASAYLEATAPDGRVVGFDADPAALAAAQEQLKEYGDRVVTINANFANLKDSLQGGGIVAELPPRYTHILFDLGLGSHQLADPARGFSFQTGQTLSMRYGQEEPLPPSQLQCLNWLERKMQHLPDVPDLLSKLSQEDLVQIIRTYGEERYAGRIARTLKEHAGRVATASELSEVISRAVPSAYRNGRIHPATRTFQALRLAVNRELEVLTSALPQAVDLLEPGGKIAVISFHSLEDRIVKMFFKQHSQSFPPSLKVLTKKPITATDEEIAQNPRSRSAKLRVAQKIT